jgi:hypothetical protein
MAGTDENSITSADWRLASAELAFVTKIVGSEERAQELLLDGLAKGLIRWDCDCGLTVRGDFQAYPLLRATFAAARGHPFFWRRDEHSRSDMDWSTNGAVWAGPFTGFGSDGRGNSWPISDPRASTSLTASLVRLHHGDVVNMLVTLGLMPQPPAPSPLPQEPTASITQLVEAAPAAPPSPPLPGPESAPITPTAELEDKTASPLEPSFPTLQMLELKGKQQKRSGRWRQSITAKAYRKKSGRRICVAKLKRHRRPKQMRGATKSRRNIQARIHTRDF